MNSYFRNAGVFVIVIILLLLDFFLIPSLKHFDKEIVDDVSVFDSTLPNYQFYVSPEGNDFNPGTQSKPVQTINKALELTKEQISGDKIGNFTILLRSGSYFLTEPIIIDQSFNIADNATLTISSYPGENVSVNSGFKLSNGWINTGNSIWEYDLNAVTHKENFEPRTLYLNENSIPITRFPEGRTKYLKIDSITPNWEKFTFVDGIRSQLLGSGTDLVTILQWTTSRVSVENINNGILELETAAQHPGYGAFNPPVVGMRSYLENIPIEETTPQISKVWQYDKTRHVIRLRSFDDPNNLNITMPVLNNLLTVEGTPNNKIKNVRVSGINFEYSTGWLYYDPGYYYGLQAAFFSNGKHAPAISIGYANNIEFSNNTVKYVGGSGIEVSKLSTNINIVNNIVSSIGGTCVIVGQYYKVHEVESMLNINVENNLIEKCGQYVPDGVGIMQAWSKKITIRNNTVRDLPYTGISLGFVYNSNEHYQGDNIVEANRIYNVVNTLCDGGGIYTVGANPNSFIRRNVIYDVNKPEGPAPCPPYNAPNHGIFFDNSTWGFTIDYNIIRDIDGTNTPEYPGKVFGYTLTGPENLIFTSNWLNTSSYPSSIFDPSGAREDKLGPAGITATEIPSNANTDPFESIQVNNTYACGPRDRNNDGIIGITDFAYFATNYKKSCNTQESERTQNVYLSCGFMDDDINGLIDIKDFLLIAIIYKKPGCTISRSISGKKTLFATDKGFEAYAEYLGNNTWSYVLEYKGNTCAKVTASTNVSETTKAVINVTKAAGSGTQCTEPAQILKQGTFTAPEAAELTLTVQPEILLHLIQEDYIKTRF